MQTSQVHRAETAPVGAWAAADPEHLFSMQIWDMSDDETV